MAVEDRTWQEVASALGEVLDIGSGQQLQWTTMRGYVVGAIRRHTRPDNGELCSSSVLFDVPMAAPLRAEGRPIHALISWEPLSLEPSLLCRQCGSHGYIHYGRWIPA